MRTLAEILDAHEAFNYDYKLQLKKKQYVIDGLKKFIDDKEALDAEIPSDDDEDETSDEKELKKETEEYTLIMDQWWLCR